MMRPRKNHLYSQQKKCKETDMKYCRHAHVFTQKCTVLHSKTNIPLKIIAAQTHQKSHQSCHKHKENERNKKQQQQQQQQQQNISSSIDDLTNDIMILGGDNSVKQMVTIFDQMLETKEKKRKGKDTLLHRTWSNM